MASVFMSNAFSYIAVGDDQPTGSSSLSVTHDFIPTKIYVTSSVVKPVEFRCFFFNFF